MNQGSNTKEIFSKGAFTLLELLLVIAIVAALASVVVFNIRPAKVLSDTKSTREAYRNDELEKAIKAYVLDNQGNYPFNTSGLAQTAYSICTYGQTLGCDLNIDNLVSNGYLNTIPVNDGATGNKSGYVLKYSTKSVSVGTSKLTCPVGYIGVPGNSLYNTSDFCVMKYEAKNVGGIATSQAANTPWSSIILSSAVTACSNLGTNYHLITNNEWMTIARNLEQVPANWTGGTVGSGVIYSGHNDASASELAASTDDNGYSGTGNVAPSNQKRTLILSNDEVIWDFAGNLMERTNNTINCAAANCTSAEMPYDSTPADESIQFDTIVSYGQLSYDLIRPSNSSWTSVQGLGKVWTDSDAAYPSGNNHSFLRGGTNMSTSNAGIMALDLGHGPNSNSPYLGFRCAMSL